MGRKATNKKLIKELDIQKGVARFHAGTLSNRRGYAISKGINPKTFYARCNGRASAFGRTKANQALLTSQEMALVSWIKIIDRNRAAPRLDWVKREAERMLDRAGPRDSDLAKLSHIWSQRFRKRHPDLHLIN